jgi:DNA-binding SARP family transcriptional activator
MRPYRSRRLAGVATGVLSLIILVAVIAGVPAILYAAGGSPIPHTLPTWHQVIAALTRHDDGTLFLATLRGVGWVAWACFTLTTLVEALYQVRGRQAPKLVGIGGVQHLSRTLITSVIMAFSAPAGVVPVVMPAALAATAPAPAHPATLTAAPATSPHLYPRTTPGHRDGEVTVERGDTLWGIAHQRLGDPERWHELWELNQGRRMPDGTRFTDPHRMLPGFQLLLPAQARPHAQPQPHRLHAGHAHRPATAGPGAARNDAAGAGGGERLPYAAPAESPVASVTAMPGHPSDGSQMPALATTFALGMAAGGIVVSVGRLRHRQRQQRRPGRRIALPVSAAARRTERELRQAAAAADDAGTLRTCLAALADGLRTGGQPVPAIAGIHLSPARIEVLLTEPASQPPPPYVVKPGTQDMCWLLAQPAGAHLPRCAGTGRGDLLPGLVTAGRTKDSGYLLLDLEAMGVTTIDGPAGLVDQVIAAAATELATNPWAGVFDLLLAGFPELDGLGDRGQACSTLDDAIGVLSDRAQQLTAAPPGAVKDHRLADPACPDWTLTLLVSRHVPSPAQMAQLLDIARPGSGIAVLIAGDVTDPRGREAPTSLDLIRDPAIPGTVWVNVHPLGLALTACPLDPARGEAVTEIFQACQAPDVPPTAPPYSTATSPPPDRGTPPDGHASTGDSKTGAWPASPDADQGHPATPATHLAASAGDREEPLLTVEILGPLRIHGTAEPLQPKQAELVLALAFAAADGLSNETLRTMLGPDRDTPQSPDTFRQLITRTRRRLGKTPAGDEHIVHVGNSQYVLQHIALDWHQFQQLTARGDRASLWDALSVVRGRPLDGLYYWWIETALLEAITAEIVDAAVRLSGLELSAGNPAAAGRAARLGLVCDPTAEHLWRAVMEAENAAGNTAGVHKAWQDCRQAISDIALNGEPHPDTTALYHQLTHRPMARASA